jgi:predicted glycogen debranching enzyme
MMFNHLAEELHLSDGRIISLGSEEAPDQQAALNGEAYLEEFRLEAGLPVWRYQAQGFVLEKRVLLPHQQNTVFINYHLLAGERPLRLRFRPSLHFRPHDANVGMPLDHPYKVTGLGKRFEISEQKFPPLRMRLHAAQGALVLHGGEIREIFYRVEHARGYDAQGQLFSPGYFRADLEVGQAATLIASTEDWEVTDAISPVEAHDSELERRARLIAQASPKARSGAAAELVLAADQFIIRPNTRAADAARAHAAGDEVRTIIAGYHWFTDWGRDTMISLEGLTLLTGRQLEAGWVLRTFSHYVRDGLIPNLFPEGEREGLYHTADATLWYFHALDRYLQCTNDRVTLRHLLPILADIVEHHLRGTKFGIHVDPNDGLLSQGAQGYQLTWMDAKVDGWVVTPRRGKAVEINALWYNALRLLERWIREEQPDEDRAKRIGFHADRAFASFNKRFWNEQRRCLYDVVDGEAGSDASFRPNQVLSVSLPHAVLEKSRWEPVVNAVAERLLTPLGLRSLAPGEPEYKPCYDGDLRSRDAAYHQGTVWGWLVGPFIDAWLKVHPEDRRGARDFLSGFLPHLGESCIGSISEIFDAEAPYTPRGCVAQAWSVAEVLRCLVKTSDEV